jgi:hypothetical protein
MDEIVDPAAGASEGGAEQVAEPAKDSREAQRAALRERRAKSEAALDKAVESVMGDDEDDDESDLHAAKAKDEDDDPDDVEVDEDGESASVEEDEDGEGDEDEGDETEDEQDAEDELFEAQLTLRAAGVPASVIKSTARATLLAWAERVSEQGSKGKGSDDPAGAEPGDKPASEIAKKGAAEPARAALPTWSEFSKLAVDEFGASEDAVSKVFKPLHDAVGSLLEQNAEMVKQVTAANRSATQREGQAIVEKEMQRLQGKYPALKRDEKLADAVLDEARTLFAGLKARGEDVDPKAIFDRAARNVAGRPKRSDLQQLKRNGNSPAPTSRFDGEDREASTDEGYWGSIADMVEAGASRERMSRLKPPPRKQKRQR